MGQNRINNKMKYKNAEYLKDGKIHCDVYHEDLGWVPYTAAKDDIEEFGANLYNAIIKKGNIKPYKEYVPSNEELATQARDARDKLLRDLDFVVMNPLRWSSLDSEKQRIISDYRQKLLDVPQQKSFPTKINWPTKPNFI